MDPTKVYVDSGLRVGAVRVDQLHLVYAGYFPLLCEQVFCNQWCNLTICTTCHQGKLAIKLVARNKINLPSGLVLFSDSNKI
jgi:hypothetical protein